MKSGRAPLPTLAADMALFLDFDGTLAPLQDNPDTVHLPPHGDGILNTLAGRLDGALAVISGRDIRDLSRRVPLELWRAGGHGLEICAPGEAPAQTPPMGPVLLGKRLAETVAAHPGTRLEPKGAVFAVHYRAVPHHGAGLEAALATVAGDTDDYTLQAGKMVFELKPSAANKGKALKRMMQTPPFERRRPVMVGDDTTDEDAMRAAMALGGMAIKVGKGDSVAEHRIDTPDDVFVWLRGACP